MSSQIENVHDWNKTALIAGCAITIRVWQLKLTIKRIVAFNNIRRMLEESYILAGTIQAAPIIGPDRLTIKPACKGPQEQRGKVD